MKRGVESAQNQFLIARELAFHLLKHFLIRDAGAAHFILILDEDVAHLLVDAVFDGDFVHHAGADAGDDGFDFLFLDFNEIVSDELFDDFGGHVADIITVQEHLLRGVLGVFYETTSLLVVKENRKETGKRKLKE